jgi:hypothetical protein
MSKPAPSLFADALRLVAETRAELAAELLASLDGPADPDAEAAWDAEIERRIAAIEAGMIRLEPWTEGSAESRRRSSVGEAARDQRAGCSSSCLRVFVVALDARRSAEAFALRTS